MTSVMQKKIVLRHALTACPGQLASLEGWSGIGQFAFLKGTQLSLVMANCSYIDQTALECSLIIACTVCICPDTGFLNV